MSSGTCVRAASIVSVINTMEAVGSSVPSVNIPQHSSFVELLRCVRTFAKSDH